MKKPFSLSLLSAFILISCTNDGNINTVTEKINNQEISVNKNTSGNLINRAITGHVDWDGNSKFGTKATLADIATSATVSLIYPHDHATLANQTVATGITDASANFTINPDVSFTPADQEIYVLEVVKRLGGVNNDLISLRTFLRWDATGNKWDSMTTNGITINRKTSALAIITDSENLNPAKTIGTINNTVSPSAPNDINFGPKIAFRGNDGITAHIYVANSDGTGIPLKVSSGISTDNGTVNFSADGFKVVFKGYIQDTFQIYVANSDGKTSPVLVSGGTTTNNINPSFSPDGSKVVFQGTDGSLINHIYLANADGSSITPLKVSTTSTQSQNPGFSADGSKIVFQGYSQGAFQIYVANTNGSPAPVVISTSTYNVFPRFSHDGTNVAFQAYNGSPVMQIYVANSSASSNPVLVSTGSSINNVTASFSPDGTKVLFQGTDTGSVNQIYIANADGSSITPLKISTGTSTGNNNPSFSPDGNKVLFQGTDVNNVSQIYIANSNGTGPLVQISTGTTTDNISPRFSPDGNKVVFQGTDTGSVNQIYIANADGIGNPTLVSTTTSTNDSPKFSNELKLTTTKINTVSDVISTVLASNRDPFRYVEKQGSTYGIRTGP